jgi:hypothetical protein
MQNHRDHRDNDQEVNQSSSHMEHPKPEGPSQKQNDRQGDEHKPFLQLKMTATHRKVGGHASHLTLQRAPTRTASAPPTYLIGQ